MISNPQVYLKANNGLVVYFINGDSLGATTKKDCEYRIRQLCKAGLYDTETRNILLAQLKALKRPY